MAEEFAFNQCFRNRSTIERNEGFIGPETVIMDGLSDRFFAGPTPSVNDWHPIGFQKSPGSKVDPSNAPNPLLFRAGLPTAGRDRGALKVNPGQALRFKDRREPKG